MNACKNCGEECHEKEEYCAYCDMEMSVGGLKTGRIESPPPDNTTYAGGSIPSYSTEDLYEQRTLKAVRRLGTSTLMLISAITCTVLTLSIIITMASLASFTIIAQILICVGLWMLVGTARYDEDMKTTGLTVIKAGLIAYMVLMLPAFYLFVLALDFPLDFVIMLGFLGDYPETLMIVSVLLVFLLVLPLILFSLLIIVVNTVKKTINTGIPDINGAFIAAAVIGYIIIAFWVPLGLLYAPIMIVASFISFGVFTVLIGKALWRYRKIMRS